MLFDNDTEPCVPQGFSIVIIPVIVDMLFDFLKKKLERHGNIRHNPCYRGHALRRVSSSAKALELRVIIPVIVDMLFDEPLPKLWTFVVKS